jgi:predicted aconitase with swiveling domain
MTQIIKGRTIARGKAAGKVLMTKDPISFLGNVNPETGEIVDPGHELFGKSIKGTVLVFPQGKGSTVGSYVLYQLKKNDAAPAAIINLECEPIVAVGAIISEIPLIDKLETNPYDILKDGDEVTVNSADGFIEIL